MMIASGYVAGVFALVLVGLSCLGAGRAVSRAATAIPAIDVPRTERTEKAVFALG